MSFHENWFSDDQARFLSVLGHLAKPLAGAVLEFGSWEGKSTCSLANSVFPDPVIAVDTWLGNLDEAPDHATVQILRERDVHRVFLDNVATLTQGNVEPVKQDCHLFMSGFRESIKFCHIDACHDYPSVKSSIEAVVPLLVPGGIVCGDDFLHANLSSEALQGGVERAVRECLPGFKTRGNLWYWVKAHKSSA